MQFKTRFFFTCQIGRIFKFSGVGKDAEYRPAHILLCEWVLTSFLRVKPKLFPTLAWTYLIATNVLS